MTFRLTTKYAGKSGFLFYLLALRLLARQPTIFQRDANTIYLFFENGVRRLSRNDLDPSVNLSDTWALLDAKQEEKTAPIFLLDRSSLFLVIASSLRGDFEGFMCTNSQRSSNRWWL